jgi:hypothetical protein
MGSVRRACSARLPLYRRVTSKSPERLVLHLPPETGYSCKDLGITTVDREKNVTNVIPNDFNPRPLTNATPVPGP